MQEAFRMIFRRFATNINASMLIMTAIGVPVLLILASLVVDVGRAYQTQTRLSFAADAGALAGAITFTERQQVGPSQRTALKYYAANLPKQFASTLPLTKITVDPSIGLVIVTPETTVPVYLHAHNDMNVSARAAAIGGTSSSSALPLEVSLVLDVTTSMAKNNKMQGMKEAAKTLIDVVLDANPQARIALVPFNNFVRLDTKAHNYERWLNEKQITRFYQYTAHINNDDPARPLPKWRGCLINNLPPADTDDFSYRNKGLIPFNEDMWVNDKLGLSPVELTARQRQPHAAPTGIVPVAYEDAMRHPMFIPISERNNDPIGAGRSYGVDDSCILPSIVPLSRDKTLLKNRIEAIANAGYGWPGFGTSGTIGSFGMLWGWRAISPLWKNEWPAVSEGLPADYQDTKKALVFLTDGLGEMPGTLDYTWSFGAYGNGAIWANPSMARRQYTWASYGLTARTYEQADLELDERLKKVCDTIRSKTDITVYSIGFDVLGQPGGAERAQRVLGDCASKPDTFHLVSTNQQLRQLFQQIGEGLLTQDSNVHLVE
jgi:Flp pilus assembly protein TadG